MFLALVGDFVGRLLPGAFQFDEPDPDSPRPKGLRKVASAPIASGLGPPITKRLKVNASHQYAGMKGQVTVFGSASSKDGCQRRVVCYGDSNTVGFYNNGRGYQPYGQTLATELVAAGVPCEVAVCGLCSFTTKDLLVEQNSDFIKTRAGLSGRGLARILDEESADLVIIMTGTNDLGMNTSLETIVQHVAQLHALCHERGIPTVAVAPTQVCSRALRSLRQRLADLLEAWAKSTPGVVDFIDVEDLLPRPCGKDGSLKGANKIIGAAHHWERDQLHMSAIGSQELGRRLVPHVSSWLNRIASEASVPQPRCRSRSSSTPTLLSLGASSPPTPRFAGRFPRARSPTPSACAGLRRASVGIAAPGIAVPMKRRSNSIPFTGALRPHRGLAVPPTFGILANPSLMLI